MQEKHAEAKKKDVARKKAERQKFKDAAENQPRKFKAVLDKIKSATQTVSVNSGKDNTEKMRPSCLQPLQHRNPKTKDNIGKT